MIDEKALDEYECEGQMSLIDYNDDANTKPMIAVSKIFARALKQMNLPEWKTLIYALTHINFTAANRNVVYLDKKRLAALCGIKSPDSNHMSTNLFAEIKGLPKHSYIEIALPDQDVYESGVIITRLRMLKGRVKIKFEDDYLPLFSELKNGEYITMWADDLFAMQSERAILLYEDMRLHSDTRTLNSKIYTTKDIKTLFGIPKDGKGSYMRDNGGFNRPAFERKVLGPACEDLLRCQMVKLQLTPDGKMWEKVKKYGYVVGYRLSWIVTDRPAVISAADKPRIQQAIEKDPQILKVAKDIVDGKKRKKAGKNQLPVADPGFPQRDDDLDALALQLQFGEIRQMQRDDPNI